MRSSPIKAKQSSQVDNIYAQAFEIIPAEVVFKDIEVNQYY